MRTWWRTSSGVERALLGALYLAAFWPFLLLGGSRGSLAGSILFWIALLPVALAGVAGLNGELRLRRAVERFGVNRAIAREQLVLHYQPQVRLDPPVITSVEALVRWQHPRRGILPPGAFLPAVADSRLSSDLDLAVLRMALRQAAEWARAGVQLNVAVNFAPRSLLDPGLLDAVSAALSEYGVPPERLEVEVTEVAFENGRGFQEPLERLKALGVGIALDDFGVGHSSLARLVQLPVDRLKIDRDFVSRMATDRRSESVVRATIDVAHDLSATVVAEGVEDADSLARLRTLECDFAQGYLLCPPVPAAEIEGCLERMRDVLVA